MSTRLCHPERQLRGLFIKARGAAPHWKFEVQRSKFNVSISALLVTLLSLNWASAAPLSLTPEEQQWLDDHPVIRVAPDPDYPPFEFFNRQGIHTGMTADILKLIEGQLNVRFKSVRLASWDACLKQAQQRGVDMWSAAAPTPQRQAYMNFTEPYVKLPGSIITQVGPPGNLSLDDLVGQEVVVVRGYLWQDHLTNTYPGINLVLANTTTEALRMVSFGRVAAMIGDIATTSYYQGQESLVNLTVAGSIERYMDLSLAVRNDWPQLRDILQKALDAISPTEMQAIRQRWTNAMTVSPQQGLSLLWKGVIAAVSTYFLFMCMLLLVKLRSARGLERDAQPSQEINQQLQVNRRKILTNSALSLVVTALVVTSVTNFLLYRQAFQQKRLDLMQTVSSQVRLIDAVARFDRLHSDDVGAGAESATFAQVVDAHEYANQLGDTGEFVFAHLVGDKMVFPMRPRYYEEAKSQLNIAADSNEAITVPFVNSTLAEPMRRALRGERGTMMDRDYRGVRVLAAYEPLKEIPFGIVAKIDLTEVRSPFFQTGFISLLTGLLFASIGVWIQVRVTSPLIQWIQRQKEFLETVLDSLTHPFYVIDARNYCIKIMNAAARLRGAVGALTCHALTHHRDTPCSGSAEHPCPLETVIQTKEPTIVEHEHISRDGDKRSVEVHGYPILDTNGEVSEMIEYSLDITERKKAEVALQHALKRAEAATQAKSDFLANMSHEIRTPMNGIIGMTELALDTELTSEQRDYLNTVQSSAEALLTLINDILDFSKIEAGKLELDPIDFALRDSMADMLNTLAVRAQSKGLELAYSVQAPIRDALNGDVYRLRQILMNLVGNAIKFTETGEIVVEVEAVTSADNKHELHFSVRDTGVGIAADKLDKIFNPFEQEDTSTTRKFGGTGLGLTISMQLVAMMGGRIWAESKEGQGSTFHFTSIFQEGKERPKADLSQQREALQSLRVLIVDDNNTNRRILEEILKNWQMLPQTVPSAAEALAAVDRAHNAGQSIQLILSDVNMPEMDGFELVNRIREGAQRDIPFVLLTSAARPGDVARCRKIGVAAHLIKPVKQSLLMNAIADAMGQVKETVAKTSPVSASETMYDERPPLRILLAEDNAVNQKFAVRVITKAGHSVEVANNGVEAVNAWEQGDFDLILMDIQMPEMDGLTATRRIRELEQQGTANLYVPIIAMTANAMKGDREMCLEAGMDGYVSKPVKRKVLFTEIERVLSSGDD
ncbi:response regulator [Planctomycetota bacterium]